MSCFVGFISDSDGVKTSWYILLRISAGRSNNRNGPIHFGGSDGDDIEETNCRSCVFEYELEKSAVVDVRFILNGSCW